MKKVLIPTRLETAAADTLTSAGYQVIQDADTPLADQAQAHPDAEVLIVRSEKVTAELIDSLPSLKLIVRAGAGYDSIDTAHARGKGVDVMNTPGANANAVAEEVVAMILANYRHIVTGDVTTRAGGWEKKNLMGTELSHKTVGIIGMGHIGRLVARRLKGFEPTILASSRSMTDEEAWEYGVRLCGLDEIFSQSDIITIHVKGGPATKNLVNAELIARMKPDAVLVNCARFGIVDEEALRDAMAGGHHIQYLTDVYAEDKPGDKPVAELAALMLPHLGASTHEANLTAARRSAEQTIAYFADGSKTYVVN